MTKRLKLFVPSNPMPKERPRLGRNGAYTPAKTQAYEELVGVSVSNAIALIGYEMPKAHELVMVILQFYRSDKRRADVDNLTKSVLDAMNGLAYEDDSFIGAMVVTVERGVREDACGVGIEIVPYYEELGIVDNLSYRAEF